jgi:hypothetical protein
MLDWAEQKIVEAAGLRPEHVTPRIERLARIASERCYYIDRAADWLLDELEFQNRYF